LPSNINWDQYAIQTPQKPSVDWDQYAIESPQPIPPETSDLAKKNSAESPTTLNTAARLVKGAVTGLAGLGDLGTQAVAGIPNLIGGAAELVGANQLAQSQYNLRDQINQGATLAERTGQGIDNLTEGTALDTKAIPGDTVGDIAETAGEFITPGGLFTKGMKAAKGLGKLTRAEQIGNVAGSAGAATALNTERLTQEGTPQALAEDILKAMFGDVVGRKALSPEMAKGLMRLAKNPVQEALGHGFAAAANPEKELARIAREEGINVPLNVLVRSKGNSFLANNMFESIFASKAWKENLKHLNDDMMAGVKNALDDVSPKLLGKDAASEAFRTELKAVSSELEKLRMDKYAKATELLKPTDRIKPIHTMEALSDIEKKVTAPSPSPAQKAVLQEIKTLRKAWGLEEAPRKGVKLSDIAPPLREKAANKIKAISASSSSEIPVTEMISQRSATLGKGVGDDLPYGVRAWFDKMASAMEKDIATTNNPEFLQAFRQAQTFFATDIAGRVRTDLSKSLQSGTFPKEAYAFMDSPRHVKELQRLVGESPKGIEIMQDLKRAKLQEVLHDKVVTGDTLSAANLATLFEKRSIQQPMLKELLGSSYDKMRKLSKLARGLQQAGADFTNTSKTAVVGKEMAALLSLFNPTKALKTLPVVATLKGLSKAMTNPKIIDRALEIAEKRAANKQAGHPRTLAKLAQKTLPRATLFAGLNQNS